MNKTFIAVLIGSSFALTVAWGSPTIDDAKAQQILKAAGCTGCHSVDKKGMGPDFHTVAQKRNGDSDALAVVAKDVREGSKGVYGSMKMPATPEAKISDADLRDLVQWVLTK